MKKHSPLRNGYFAILGIVAIALASWYIWLEKWLFRHFRYRSHCSSQLVHLGFHEKEDL